MPYIGIGCAFLVECGPGEDQRHLHVLITHMCANGAYLAVSLQTLYPGSYYDPSCVFQGGEHAFITHRSWIPYKHSAKLSHDGLKAGFERFDYISKEKASDEVVSRMGEGLLKSPRATKTIKSYYLANKDKPSTED